MRELTIRKSVRPKIKEQIPSVLDEALEWMKERYPDVDFDRVGYIFSSSYNRSRYFPNQLGGKYAEPNVCISTDKTLRLYKKPSLGMKETTTFVGNRTQMVCAMIHELTHHVQYERKHREGNELDTTKNELEYLKEFHPEHYKYLVK